MGHVRHVRHVRRACRLRVTRDAQLARPETSASGALPSASSVASDGSSGHTAADSAANWFPATERCVRLGSAPAPGRSSRQEMQACTGLERAAKGQGTEGAESTGRNGCGGAGAQMCSCRGAGCRPKSGSSVKELPLKSSDRSAG